MVKTLVLVRHGDAEPAVEGVDGSLRNLTRAGSDALAAAYPSVFSKLDPTGVEVWSSPAVRALQTAEIASRAMGISDIETHQSLYDQNLDAFLAELDAAKAPTVVVVGHVPFMDRLVERLLGEPHPFGKGAVAALDMPSDPTNHATLLWSADAPDTSRWDSLQTVDAAVAHVAQKLDTAMEAFLATPEDEARLLELRQAIRRMRSVYAFLCPWQSGKQNKLTEKALKGMQVSTNRLRAVDIFSDTVDGLVETGELGENSLLPMACANERQLELESVLALYKKKKSRSLLKKAREAFPAFKWRKSVRAAGLSQADFQQRFDEEMSALDEDLFGLDLADAKAVTNARRDAKEVHYVASRLGVVLGPERAQMSAFMDEIQNELGSLSIASDNQKLANEFSKSPRFRGVRADLGVVARDQAEVVSATLSGLRRREARSAKGKTAKKDKDSKN